MSTGDLDFRACERTVRFVLLDFQTGSGSVSSSIFTTWLNYEMPLLCNCYRKWTFFPFVSTNCLVKIIKNKKKTISPCTIANFQDFFMFLSQPGSDLLFFGCTTCWTEVSMDGFPPGLYSFLLSRFRSQAVPEWKRRKNHAGWRWPHSLGVRIARGA